MEFWDIQSFKCQADEAESSKNTKKKGQWDWSKIKRGWNTKIQKNKVFLGGETQLCQMLLLFVCLFLQIEKWGHQWSVRMKEKILKVWHEIRTNEVES